LTGFRYAGSGIVGPSGMLAGAIVEAHGKEQHLPFDESVRFQPESRSAA